jgi:CRP/FNR family transcriptional regulator, anaerobic regulatory protein
VERCDTCRLRLLGAFLPNTPDEIACIQSGKVGEQNISAGGVVLEEGKTAHRFSTLLSGWAFRFKTLPDGRRQILNFLLPGDLIGVNSRILDVPDCGVEALTDVRLCMFGREHGQDLSRATVNLAVSTTSLIAWQEHTIHNTLLSVGRRSASERVAWLLLHLWRRAEVLNPMRDGALELPVTQAHMADALGLSLVHTNRTLQALRRLELFELSGGWLRQVDEQRLRTLAQDFSGPAERRPLF